MTKKEITDRVNEIEKSITSIDFPDSVEISDLNEKIKFYEMRRRMAIEAIKFGLKQTREDLVKERIVLLDELERIKEDGKYPVSHKVAKWFKNLSRGIVDGHKWEIEWVDEKEEYVIYKIPGGKAWSGLGNTRYYATKHVLTKIGLKLDYHGLGEYEGRGSKEKMEELKKIAQSLREGLTS